MEYSAFAEALGLDPNQCVAFLEEIRRLSDPGVSEEKLFDGMRDALDLARRIAPLAIVTGNLKPVVDRFLEKTWFQ